MSKVNCFEKIKHREVQTLQDEFDRLVPDDTDMPESEQKEIGKKIVLDYYKKLNQEINDLKVKLNKEPSELPDKSEAGNTMATVYDNLISEIKNEANEQRKFKNQTSADQVQIIKTIENEGQAAEIADNAEAAGVVIRKIDDVLSSTPEAQAREKGEKEVDGTVIKRQEPIPAITGNDVDVLFAKDVKQPAKYAVVELSDLQASHYSGIQNEKHFIPEAQPRNRGGLEVLKNEAKAKADVLDPSQLAENNIAYYGSPVINSRGEVIQGNGRAEAIDYYYNNNAKDSKGYRAMIEGKSESLGLDASEVSKMKQPVLVRMADVNDEQAIILGNYTSSDLEDVKQKDADVKAAIGKLSGEDFKRLSNTVSSKISESDTLKSAIRENAKSIINLLMDIGALRADNREQYFNQDGVTPEGIDAAYNIVRQLLFEGGPNDLSGKFDNLPFAQREAIEKTIPAIISNPELKNHVQSVIEILHDKQENGDTNFNTWAKQYDLFKGKSPVDTYGKPDLAFAKRIDEAATQKEISTTIKEVAQAMNGKPADMFESAKEGLPFEDAIAEKNITFQFQEPSSEEVNDMKEVIKEMVDAGVLTLKEIQGKVATELEDDTDELRDLVTVAYHEYGKDKENTPKQITGGVIGRIGKWLAKMFGGTQADKIFIAKDTESLERKAAELQGDIKYQKSLRDYVNIVLTSIALSSTPIQTANEKVPVATEVNERELKSKQAITKLLESYYAENKEEVPQEVIDRTLKVWERVGKPLILPDSTKNNDRAFASLEDEGLVVLGNITDFDDLVAELSHAAQYSSQAELNERGYATQAEYDKVEYTRKGSVEYDAHKIIEPMIAAYILNGKKAAEAVKNIEIKNAVSKYGLTNVLYQISVKNATQLPYKKNIPTTSEFVNAVENTPGASLTDDGLVLNLTRYQHENQDGEPSLRTGVFYLPTGSKNERHYKGGKSGYGGQVKYSGETLIKAPLFVKGATGGKAPEMAYDSINGKGAYQKMRSDVLSKTTGWNKRVFPEDIAQMLTDYNEGSDYNENYDIAYNIFNNSKVGNTLSYAIQENIVANSVRKNGYDSVLGYSKDRQGNYFISEVFDVRELTYPSKDYDSEIAPEFTEPKFMKSSSGEILGFSTQDGKIYLNAEHLNPNTPIHEAGHLMVEWMKQNDTKVYDRGIELVTGSRYYDSVKSNKFYKEEASNLPADQREEYFKQEALAAAIGDRGAQFVTEAKKKGFAEWLNNLWEAIKNTLGLKNITAKELSELTLDEFAKRAAADILRQQTEAKEALNEITDQLKNWGLSFKDAEIIQGVADTDEKILNGELSREQYLRMKINLLESQQTMQDIVRKSRTVFGDNYIQKLMDIADTEKDISLPTKRNLATRLKEEVAQGNKFVFDKVAMWAKKFATEASAAMNLGKPIDSVKELDNVSEPANEIMNQIGAEIKEGENIVLDAVSETTSDEILAFKQREEDLLNEIADLKQQLEDLENKKSEEKQNKKSKLTTNDYAEKAKAANNRLGNDKKSIIDKIKEIIKKC